MSGMNSGTPMKKNNMIQMRSTSGNRESSAKRPNMEMMGVQVADFNADDKIDSTSEKSKSVVMERLVRNRETYIAFFKMQFETMNRMHPRWGSSKISKIVGLQWKKRFMDMRKKTKMIKMRPVKPISGRKAFINKMKSSGMSYRSIIMMWRRFPRETRQVWSMKGNPMIKSTISMTTPMHLRMAQSGVDRVEMNRLNFLNLKVHEQ